MHICFISRRFFPAISGMSVYALNLIRQLSRDGHEVTMISQYRADPDGVRVYGGGPPPSVPGVRVIGLESKGEQAVGRGEPADFEADLSAMVAAVEAEHARRPFDLIHAQYGYPNGLAAMEASRRLGIPNLVSIQGGDGHWVGTCCSTHRDAIRAVLGHAGALLIGSASFAEEVCGLHGISPERFTIIPGATDTERFRPRDGAVPGDLREPPVLLFHGRVDARKGIIELIDAFAALRCGGRRLRMIVSGIGPDVEAVGRRVADLGLDDAVELAGYSSYADAPSVYRRGDIFVSPTYSEGFSNTILEAMASGLPIVSTRSVGVVDCLEDGRDGLLVEPKDADALAGAIARLLDDDTLRRRLAGAALDEVRSLYSWPAVTRTIEQAYAEVAVRPVDNSWTEFCDPSGSTVATSDLSCRFRLQPHLL
ncbi:glycosyltransferase family 4 protein [Tundrisphaera sp. TA3]|uniref:glycosyltransferase family 4 protein n=1 Tax=Tundrisphaera sp. TA3 TaxID=3435775 RepID=UPI003EBBC703